ncbi:dGTP triphosphohydrolase [Pseudothioclava arenosa]|uniref:Deoxyguanosinetriphosphate triphosphohydrolase n=1 Tax=Pseudothioclava arenosa TaxID=1795308 RepID=A0A2A4CNF1_9RHOB|nr:dNTP triphosphohydrolase [Pseudothioclava arenosa]PCD76115.1 deoxyguanosinetriphosphate triphosphohydrolase [Pseudothioclava arenosa]
MPIETSSVGRSLGLAVGHWLEEKEFIEKGKRHVVSGVVQAAALAHDIGNPPFGHSGENAIGGWFSKELDNSRSMFSDLTDAQKEELKKFEGNAQGFRLLARLEMYRSDGGMRLTHATYGAFTKYPALAISSKREKDAAEKIGGNVYKGLDKFGVFISEYDIFKKISERLGLLVGGDADGEIWWCRHPLVFLVEAADDICYNIMDLEDAYTAGDLPFEAVKDLLSDLFGGSNQTFDSRNEEVSYYRARAINAAIPACVEAFKSNYDKIMRGEFSASLVSASNLSEKFRDIKGVARDQIFTAPRKTKLDVAGRAILHRVLSGLLPLFEELQEKKWDKSKLSEYHRQLVGMTQIDLRDVSDPYSAAHALTDYVSGMTDRYAVKIDRLISGQIS